MVKSEKLIEYVRNIINTRDPNSIKELDIKGELEIESKKIIEYSDIVKHWKLENDDLITKEYNKIKNSETPNIIGLFSMFYLKNKDNFLTVGKYQGNMFHLDITCKEYSTVLKKAMLSEYTVFILTYLII